jgi:dihydroorotase-like cyclic amidohydrolase
LVSKASQAHIHAHCDVDLFAGGSEDNVATVGQLAGQTVGLKLYLDQTHGPLLVSRLETVIAHLRRWPGVVAVHAVGWRLATVIGLAHLYGRHLHCCHVSRKIEIDLIRQAKERGAPVTCEVTPHHLYLTDADARRLGPLGDMRPTLGDETDRDALWANLDVVDCIASDHAPHTLEEKQSETPPPGVPGLETTLPLMLTAVHESQLSLDRLVELLYDGPRRIYGLPEQPQTTIEIDTAKRHIIGEERHYTKCNWTPFAGMPVTGRLQTVILRGKTVYADGRVTT